MLFLAKLTSLKETKFINPPNFLILFKARCKIRRCSNFERPLPDYIWLFDKYSYRRPKLSSPPISYSTFYDKSSILRDLFLLRPFIDVILFEFNFNTRRSLCLDKSGIAAI